MVYQISIKDIKKALFAKNHSNIVVVVCSENPRMSCHIQFLMKDTGEIYYNCGYQVGNYNVCLADNTPIWELVYKFNKAMRDYDIEYN